MKKSSHKMKKALLLIKILELLYGHRLTYLAYANVHTYSLSYPNLEMLSHKKYFQLQGGGGFKTKKLKIPL